MKDIGELFNDKEIISFFENRIKVYKLNRIF